MTVPPKLLFASECGLLLALSAVSMSLSASGTLSLAEGPEQALILWEVRLPRVLLALIVGGGLGLSGAVLQGLLRNPLAEPGIIGASAMAALGAVLCFYFGLYAVFPLALPLSGMAGALAAVAVLAMLSGRDAGTLTVILAGIALSSGAGALTALALNLAPSPFAVFEIVFWLMGSLADRDLGHVGLILVPTAIGWIMLAGLGRALDALTLGPDVAASLGFGLRRVTLSAVIGTALTVGAAVSVTGIIGFVGLVIPHLVRPLVGYQPRLLLPASALGGAVLVLAADLTVRLLSVGQELKLGVVTALIGAPFFIWVLFKTRREQL